MSDSNPPAEPSRAQDPRLDNLTAAVESLRVEIAVLRRGLGREIRARRIVVVDDDGFERVVIAAEPGFGYVTVHARAQPERSTTAELFANDRTNGSGPHVGVALSDAGDVTATLEVVHGEPARLWLGDEPPETGGGDTGAAALSRERQAEGGEEGS